MGAPTTSQHADPPASGGRWRPVLRPVRPDDEGFLRHLHRSTRDDLAVIPGLDGARLDALVDLQFRAQRDAYALHWPHAHHDLVLVGGEPVGRLYVDRSTATHQVVDIALLPGHRRRGIGTELLRGIQDRAAAAGARVRLQARAGGRADSLYRRLGFLPVPTGTAAPGPGDRPTPADGLDVELEWRAEHWLPIHVQARRDSRAVDWFDAGDVRAADAFFVDAFHRAHNRHRADPGRRWRRNGTLAELLSDAERAPGLAPSGFVLHMSRCGSTLLARMLMADPDNLVVSEPPAVDQVLRAWWSGGLAEEELLAVLRAVVSVLGRPRHGERRLFLKLDAWHTTMLPVLQRAFPHTPWVFLHRDPVEVLVSLERRTPAFVVPGGAPAEAFGTDLATASRLDPDDYAVFVLGAICRAARAGLQAGRGGRPVAYDNLPGAVDDVLAHFGVGIPPARVAAMVAVSRWDAKEPTLRFAPDGPAKRVEADARLRQRAGRLTELVSAGAGTTEGGS